MRQYLFSQYKVRALILVIVFTTAFFVAPSLSEAQVCTPTCGTGQTCIYSNTAETQTSCITSATTDANGQTTVDEFVVTAPAKSTTGFTFAQVVANIVSFANGYIIPLLFALAFVYFLINIVRYFFIESSAESQEKGQKALLYGLIGLGVLFSVWGLINLFLNTLNAAVGISSS